MRIALLGIAILLAGCSGPPLAADAGPAITGPEPFHRIYEFSYVTSEELGDTALELQLSVGKENDCIFGATLSTLSHGPGPDALLLVEQADANQSGSAGSARGLAAHVGPLDSRLVTDGESQSSSQFAVGGTYSGSIIVTWVALGLKAWPEAGLLDGSLEALAQCQKPFDLTSASIGHTVLLEDQPGFAGGVGASVGFDLAASVSDTAGIDIAAPRARAGIGDASGVGTATLQSPNGTATWNWDLTKADEGLISGGPGNYGFTLTNLAPQKSTMWAVVFGLDGPFDLSKAWGRHERTS